MLIGHTIHAAVGVEQVFYLTPWMSSKADSAHFSYQAIHSTLPSTEVVQVFHKRAEDSGSSPGAVVATFSALGSTGIYEAKCSNLKDLHRFRVAIDNPDGLEGWLHFRFLPATWFAEAGV